MSDNVYRSASNPITLLEAERKGDRTPFDISVLRHVSYEDTAAGLADLSDKLKQRFDYLDANPTRPDNQFQHVAARVEHQFPNYAKSPYKTYEHDGNMLAQIFSTPGMVQLFQQGAAGQRPNNEDVAASIASTPESLSAMFQLLLRSGKIDMSDLLGK